MTEQILVPTDGSEESMQALPVAAGLAAALDCRALVVGYAGSSDADALREDIATHVSRYEGADIDGRVEPLDRPVAWNIADIVDATPSTIVCMATRGRGRSASLFGSVSAEILERVTCPLVLVGPECAPGAIATGGTMLLTTDGSSFAGSIASVAAELGRALQLTIEAVTVIDPNSAREAATRLGASDAGPSVESAPARRLATSVANEADSPFTFEVLHGKNAAREVLDYAKRTQPSAIALATHDPGGLERIVHGSVMADIVRHATCPVVTLHPGEDQYE